MLTEVLARKDPQAEVAPAAKTRAAPMASGDRSRVDPSRDDPSRARNERSGGDPALPEAFPLRFGTTPNGTSPL